jgi:thiol-disulfide isomerase/thioredoxin
MAKYFLLALLFLNPNCTIRSQATSATNYPQLDSPCPYFDLPDIRHFSLTHMNLNDLKGQNIILDFFAEFCATCFESFPKINELQKEFKGKVQFILIGKESANMRTVYEKFRTHYNLDLPVAFDSIISKQFQVWAVPYVIWIDKKGIVREITTSDELRKNNIQAFVDGNPPELPMALNYLQQQQDRYFDPKKPLLTNENGGLDTDFFYRSLLMKWTTRQGFWSNDHISSKAGQNLQEIGITLSGLYRLAFGDTILFTIPAGEYGAGVSHYGEWALKPVLEVHDPRPFIGDFSSQKNIYSYNLILPVPKTAAQLQRVMQNDLYNVFGSNVIVTTRKMPYWRLVSTPENKIQLMTKGAKKRLETSQGGLFFVNQPIGKLIFELWYYRQNDIFIDETGINSNIDIKLNAVMTDFAEVRKALAEAGLYLVQGERDVKVIVISDPASIIDH